MSHLYPFLKEIQLHVKNRISPEDAARQEDSAREILRRLKDQPGLILADEVGMGKTFVALAVAVSVAVANRHRRPVVVMVPPSLQQKWPRDFKTFVTHCLPAFLRDSLRYGSANRAEDFLKFLDDPPERRRSILFVTHGAMSRGLTDKWIKLALIRQALRYRHGSNDLKRALYKVMGRLLRLAWMDRSYGAELWTRLMDAHPSSWLGILEQNGVDPEEDDNPETNDDPVPRAVYEVIGRLNTDELYQTLESIPRRETGSFDDRLREARRGIQSALRPLWAECITQAKLRLPLLILDEAHHLKNEDTLLASLFRCQDAANDAEEFSRGALYGVFERMLFLTATPFQLGHGELCSVIKRFGGVDWKGRLAPRCGQQGFSGQVEELLKALDHAQEAAHRLDDAWGRLRREDLVADGVLYSNPDEWWGAAPKAGQRSAQGERVVRCYGDASKLMRGAEKLLQPWVIRHLKPRMLPPPRENLPRRNKLPGRAISESSPSTDERGLEITAESLVPFLLAARATACSPESRSVFAEGLASCYEAFLHTRKAAGQRERRCQDGDEDGVIVVETGNTALTWYLRHLEAIVPQGDVKASLAHPKIAATVRRVVREWSQGEKVLVFCHFVATGRVLRRAISHAIQEEIARLASEKLGCPRDQVFDKLERLGKRFFDNDSPAREATDKAVQELLSVYRSLSAHHEELQTAVRRIVRTPSFLARFFPLEREKIDADSVAAALSSADQSGMTLKDLLRSFFDFLQGHEESREEYIKAVSKIQTGSHAGRDLRSMYAPDELQGEAADLLLPNVRLVNGSTQHETRQRLMLAFNTPFYPEILVASSVMAEGVDLHLNCRHVIHHDLCWNPSTLEQRTGRVDRVGAKAERCGPISVYLPYVGETQDQKMYRVVMDRERWFSVVMGEKFQVDARSTEKLADRIPLPETLARELALRLHVQPPAKPAPPSEPQPPAENLAPANAQPTA
jgi:hypothetical protein